ncbi:MAG TPA: hypothetical protein K8W20_10100 [Pseudomonas lactis]|uniref:Uncharacterized protein n=1 Tax=Pseudomonas lactis TaxID=1615674 RepID=A0A921T7N6_9PSED|nr:hypothetical protein [Pseudomonas lactis]HJH19049.1 hypothetical protein [Pseudomonas lactis]
MSKVWKRIAKFLECSLPSTDDFERSEDSRKFDLRKDASGKYVSPVTAEKFKIWRKHQDQIDMAL